MCPFDSFLSSVDVIPESGTVSRKLVNKYWTYICVLYTKGNSFWLAGHLVRMVSFLPAHIEAKLLQPAATVICFNIEKGLTVPEVAKNVKNTFQTQTISKYITYYNLTCKKSNKAVLKSKWSVPHSLFLHLVTKHNIKHRLPVYVKSKCWNLGSKEFKGSYLFKIEK